MIVAGRKFAKIAIWEITSGKLARTLERDLSGSGAVLAVAFSPNGDLIGSAGEDNVRIWKMKPSRR